MLVHAKDSDGEDGHCKILDGTDADWIKGRVPMLKAHDAARQKKARREGKNASVGS